MGERTETVSAQTMGSAPVAPVTSVELIKVNSSSIVLDLAAWLDGGCPITSFVVEYRKEKDFGKPPKMSTEKGMDHLDDGLIRPTISLTDYQLSG